MLWIRSWLNNRFQRVCLEGITSEWDEVLSGVPQGSVLGPLLFLMYINDLDDTIKSSLLKFADDTKVLRMIRVEDNKQLQTDALDSLLKWSQDWQMTFNTDKCKVMHIGGCNQPCMDYYMKGHKLGKYHEEKDLDINVSDDLKVGTQCNQAFSKANRMLDILKQNIVNKTPLIMVNLYNTLIWLHVEYCVPAWSPYYVKDKNTLERIQHRFTKLIPGLQSLTYEERLARLGLWTLKERRNRADLIEVFKMANNLSPIPLSNYFELHTDGRTRGHSLKLIKHRCKSEVRQHFFSERVVNRWNKLDQDTISVKTIHGFKTKLEKERSKKMGLFLD